MKNVIVERPRFHGGWGSNKGKTKAWQKAIKNDDHPSREKMSIGWGDKELNENLQPLFRFLEKRVGKFWDKVYSEIRHNINPNNAVQMHILQHLEWYVCKDAIEVSKGVFQDSKGLSIGDPFFVHPKTGCLMKNPESYYFKHYHYKAGPPKYREIDGKNYIEHNGVWYEVTFSKFSEENTRYRWTASAYDVLQKDSVGYNESLGLYGTYGYISTKRQLNHKEIHKLHLREDAA